MEAVVRVLLGEAPPPLLPPGLAAAAHTAPSPESRELRGPGAEHYDEVMAMIGAQPSAVPSEPPALGGSRGGCSHDHHGAGQQLLHRADAFTPTPSQLAAAAREAAGLPREAALSPLTPAASAADTIAHVAHLHSRYWPCLRAVYHAHKRAFKARAAERAARLQPVAAAVAGELLI